MVVLPVITSRHLLFHDTGIDWDVVIFLLVGAVIIVGVLRQTGGVRIHRDLGRQARPRLCYAVILLALVSALASQRSDNVTTVFVDRRSRYWCATG